MRFACQNSQADGANLLSNTPAILLFSEATQPILTERNTLVVVVYMCSPFSLVCARKQESFSYGVKLFVPDSAHATAAF